MFLTEVALEGGSRTSVSRRGNIIHRKTEPWTATVQVLLRHLEDVGFSGAPRVIGSGYDDQGREILSFIEGEFVHPSPWSDEGVIAVGQLLKELHHATSSFKPPSDAVWRSWYSRSLRGANIVIGHCDFTPWNLVSKRGVPFAAIDWETAGPIDALVELAQVCWLNAQLCDDDVAERAGLASPEIRAKQMRLIVDAYGLSKADRLDFVDILIELAICDAADQAIEVNITPETKDIEPLWALAWRSRAAAWIVRHRTLLNNALINQAS